MRKKSPVIIVWWLGFLYRLSYPIVSSLNMLLYIPVSWGSLRATWAVPSYSVVSQFFFIR
jgi:hypothetical protein